MVVNSITAAQVINHHDISVQLDLNGVTNRGLFLKDETGEQMFTGTECPCEVLFQMDESRNLVRQPVGEKGEREGERGREEEGGREKRLGREIEREREG